MPHHPIPSHLYSNIASIRLTTRAALTTSIPPAEQTPEPPRPQYDTMKSYQRLEKAGTIASMESQQKNVRPLFAYPRKEFETPRRKLSRRAMLSKEEEKGEEDTLPLLSSSLIDTSELLDSIFSSSPTRGGDFFTSSPPTLLDFSSSLPYPSEGKVWGRSPPPVQIPARKQDTRHSSLQSRQVSMAPQESLLPTNSSIPPYSSDQDLWTSSPPIETGARHSRQAQRRRESHAPYLESSPPTLPISRIPSRRTPSAQGPHTNTSSQVNVQDFASRHRQRRSSQRMTPSPEMRFVTVLEDISEDEQMSLVEEEGAKVHGLSRRLRLRLKIEEAVAWVLRREGKSRKSLASM